MRYQTPDLEGNSIAYKGRRFWVIELAEGGSFQNLPRAEFGEFVVFDRSDNAAIATVRVRPNGKFCVKTTTMFGSCGSADTLKEAARLADEMVNEEVRASS